MKITGIIPSLLCILAVPCFPGKPLIDIDGKTMIRLVYEQAAKAKSLNEVIVATDDERIFKEVEGFGGKAIMTSPQHKNGTERCAEVARQLDSNIIINIQGDEPFIEPEQIEQLVECFKDDKTQIATLIKKNPLNEDLQSPARIKVVVNKNGEAMYFSRHVIPFVHNSPHFTVQGFQSRMPANIEQDDMAAHLTFYKHIGLYGYRKNTLLEIVKLPESPLEKAESLEQLRWLENGYKIKCAVTEYESISVDIPEDLKLAHKQL